MLLQTFLLRLISILKDLTCPHQQHKPKPNASQCTPLRRCDGIEDFRPLTGASGLKERGTSSASHSPLRKAAVIDSSESCLKNAELPGFGDNEAHGKINSPLVIAAKTLTSSARRHDSGEQDATHTEKCPELHLLLSLSLINIVIQLPVVERLFSLLLMRPGRVAPALLANALLQNYQR